MPSPEMAIWHPIRARIIELLKSGPAPQSYLIAELGASEAEVAYHCRALRNCGCIKYADSSGPEASDPIYEAT